MDVYGLHKSALRYQELEQPCTLPPIIPHHPETTTSPNAGLCSVTLNHWSWLFAPHSNDWGQSVVPAGWFCSFKIGKELQLRELRTHITDLPQRLSACESEVVSLFLLLLHTPSMMTRDIKTVGLSKCKAGFISNLQTYKPSKRIVAHW